MTFAPPTIKELAAYWVSKGGVNLGIAGDTSHAAGGTSYHLGADQLADGAYSATLPRDVAGLSNAASAIDLGRLNGSLANLQAFSRWLVGWCQSGAPGTRDVREVIYTPNGQLPIHRWSGLDNKVYTGPGNGDSSHLTHTHISFWRDSEFRPKVLLFAPYFAGGVAPDTSMEEPIMALPILNPQPVTGTATTRPGATARSQVSGHDVPFAPDDTYPVVCVGDLDGATMYIAIAGGGLVGFSAASVAFTPTLTASTGTLDEAAIRRDQIERDRRTVADHLLPNS